MNGGRSQAPLKHPIRTASQGVNNFATAALCKPRFDLSREQLEATIAARRDEREDAERQRQQQRWEDLLATVAAIKQLPRLHADAVARLVAGAATTGAELCRRIHAEDAVTGTGRVNVLPAVRRLLDEIRPPVTECTARGARLVRGQEDEISDEAERAAAEGDAFYPEGELERAAAEARLPNLAHHGTDAEPWIAAEMSSVRWQKRRIRREALRIVPLSVV